MTTQEFAQGWFLNPSESGKQNPSLILKIQGKVRKFCFDFELLKQHSNKKKQCFFALGFRKCRDFYLYRLGKMLEVFFF